ncbi:MAG TPA: FIST N-terminal domain-containing protein [Polyangiaceae bacterium]|nr:FIST N-terminal domain-containing protein [Polyangiaceae bacterium]
MKPPSEAAVGYSKLADAFEAGATAAAMARDASSGSVPPLVAIAYATVSYDQREIVRGVRSALPGVRLVGASAQGISRAGAVEEIDRVVGVALVRSARVGARAARVAGVSADSAGAGRALAEALRAGGRGPADDEPVIVWYDPLARINVDALLGGLAEGGFPRVVGGGAGQPFGPTYKTYQYFDGEVLSDAAVALWLPGARLALGLSNGVEPVGFEVTVTDAFENAIRGLDGQPALDVWVEQFGGDGTHGHNSAAWAFGLPVPEPLRDAYEGPIPRGFFGFDEKTREILLQAPIPPGTVVQVCHRTPRAVFDRAVEMGRRLKARLGGERPFLALSFECAARPAPFLGTARALEEVKQIQAELGPGLPWLGTYAWGEIAPIGPRSYVHNFTFPLCVVCDAPGD